MSARLHLSLSIIFALLLVASLAPLLARATAPASPTAAGVFLVDRTDDDASPSAQVCSVASGDCTLRGAIIKANANPGSTVALFAGVTHTLSISASGGNDATTGDLNMTAPMTLTIFCLFPPCGNAVIQGNSGWTNRILTILNNAVVKVNAITVRRGYGGIYVGPGTTLTLTNSSISDNLGTVNGAGIDNHGQLSLQDSQVLFNTTSVSGGGIYSWPGSTVALQSSLVQGNWSGAGSGILIFKGALSLVDSDVISNTSATGGGGISVSVSDFTMINSRVLSNTAQTSSGGGISIGPTSTADIRSSQIGWNSSYGSGGGLVVWQSVLTLTASTLFSNTSDSSGAGLAVESASSALLVNSTLSGNRALFNGGGIYHYNGLTTTLKNVTVAYNVANRTGNSGFGGGGIYFPAGGAVLVQNSIVAANSDNSSYLPAPNCKGNLQSKGYNLFGLTARCGISGTLTGNLLNADPLLGSLRDNGGATWTHALLPGSPAIDSADPLICLPNDQRGVSRPKNGNGLQFAWCDIGAYEYNGPTILRLFLPLIKR